ncbi:hypothetical protein [Microbacterium rhizomatis]|uniref:Uncharacterized protein n=1 Tax=Microbacterium rhizomatis TaxID=1631477 RepID=A0A5J5J2S6_9MICO|nr:hypothetical protein [Microbacterium rhizomatis]KAA9110381.1 hypothetical protein F6B43_01415 [Microbacterium rhizomatis]
MSDLNVTDPPDSISVEELIIGHLCIAAAELEPLTRADLMIETIDTWRKVWPAAEAVAQVHGVTITEPVGIVAASSILAEAGVFIKAEQEAGR